MEIGWAIGDETGGATDGFGCLRKFSFSLDGNSILHFSSAQNEFFCEGPTIYLLQNYTKLIF